MNGKFQPLDAPPQYPTSMPVPQQNETAALIGMIERVARDPGADIDKLERLMNLRERIVEKQAKTAYAAALSEMQAELPVITERGRIDIGRGKPQHYALWEDINETIRPILAKHGFGLSFRTGRTEQHIIVTGVLSHRGGHSEETTMYLPIDASGSKNPVQAVGSSTSYGKRYTAAALLNLTSRGEDDDGRAGGGSGPISVEQLEELQGLIVETGTNIAKYCQYMNVQKVEDLPASRFNDAKAALEAKRK